MDDTQVEFQSIYNTFQPKIRRYLERLVGKDEAEDLTQDVFVKVNQGLVDFRGEATLATWIYQVATHAAFDRLRSTSFWQAAHNQSLDQSSGSNAAEGGDRDIGLRDNTPSVEQQLIRQEMDMCLLGFIEKLPEIYRDVLMLSDVAEFKNKEIADILGVSLGTVKIRLHRARAKLKAELAANCDRYWIEENEFVPNLKKI